MERNTFFLTATGKYDSLFPGPLTLQVGRLEGQSSGPPGAEAPGLPGLTGQSQESPKEPLWARAGQDGGVPATATCAVTKSRRQL